MSINTALQTSSNLVTIILVGQTVFAEYYGSTLIVNDNEILKQVSSDKVLGCYNYAIFIYSQLCYKEANKQKSHIIKTLQAIKNT